MDSPSTPQTRRTPPISLIVWLCILVTIGALLFFQTREKGNPVDITQSEFETLLHAKRVVDVSIEPVPENAHLCRLVGSYYADSMAVSDSDALGRFETKVYMNEALSNQIRAEAQNVTTQIGSDWLKIFVTIFLPIILIAFLIYFFFYRQIKNQGRGAMMFGKSRARMLDPKNNKTRFSDVAGAEEAKEEITEIVDYLKDPLKFKLVGGRIPKGALLMGPPGTGKTLLARAVAAEANVPFFTISGSDFIEMFVGVGASRVRDMFEEARDCAPSLIFIDEIDAVGRSRFSGIGGGHDEREQTLNALLVEMDGLEASNTNVIVLAATNRADVLDPALLRPGRFDRQIVMDLPDIKGRRQILDVHVKNIRVDDSVDIDKVAKSTPGFSGADLANLVNEAALHAARRDSDRASMLDFEDARDKVSYGRERKSRSISERERRIVAYHESGHAIIGMLLKDSVPIHKVTIIPRGQAYLGANMLLPSEDRYLQSRKEMEADLRMSMGGRVTEEVFFDDITGGAAGDIQHATRLARAMVCIFGMSPKLGTVQYDTRSEHIYLGKDITKNETCSEDTAREIDLEVRNIITTAYEDAKKMILEYRDKVKILAEKLLVEETIDGKDLYALLDLPNLHEEPAHDNLSPSANVSVPCAEGE